MKSKKKDFKFGRDFKAGISAALKNKREIIESKQDKKKIAKQLVKKLLEDSSD